MPESTPQQQLEHLAEIRALMERSTRFLSLSGLSGVSAGVIALAGAYSVKWFFGLDWLGNYTEYSSAAPKLGMDYQTFLVTAGLATAILAVCAGAFFTWRKARQKGYKIWDRSAQLLAINLAIPLTAGGIFCLILLFKYQLVALVAPATLIFYGLTLLNASKYTLNEVRYLGVCEIILGLIATYYIGYGLVFWSIGFGILHIFYGTIMYWKHER